MANTIQQQYGDMTSRSSQQSTHHEKEGEARIAEANRVINLQTLEKDIILSADPDNQQAATHQPANERPQLPTPESVWNAFQKGGDDQEGLISIIGAVLALQAKTNSTFWSTVWKQASASMMMQVKFAPIISEAITSQYQNQSLSTKAQADQAEQGGRLGIMAFVGGMAMGGGMEFYEQYNSVDALAYDSEDEIADDLSGGASGEDSVELNQINDEIDPEEQSIKDMGSKLLDKGKGVLEDSGPKVMKALQKALTATQTSQMLNQAVTELTVNQKYLNLQAGYQAQEGVNASLSKEAEMYSQFYGQSFGREEDLRQGSSQNIDYAMNILQQAANTITATVKSMFGG